MLDESEESEDPAGDAGCGPCSMSPFAAPSSTAASSPPGRSRKSSASEMEVSESARTKTKFAQAKSFFSVENLGFVAFVLCLWKDCLRARHFYPSSGPKSKRSWTALGSN